MGNITAWVQRQGRDAKNEHRSQVSTGGLGVAGVSLSNFSLMLFHYLFNSK